jgi:hypothetical protein
LIARGQLHAFPRLFMAQMRGEGEMRDAKWKAARNQSVRSA